MKKLISVLLMISLLVSFVAISASAYSWNDPEAITVDEALAEHNLLMGEIASTYRYYFLMPNGHNGDLGDNQNLDSYGKYAPTWYTKLYDDTPATSTAGIYWWDSGVADPPAWFGYLPSGVEECDSDIYYADVPRAATTIIWNNGVDGGMDDTDPIYYCAAQSNNIPCEYYDAGESDNYPDGTDNFNNMIYVIDPDLISISDFSLKQTCGGEWYYYYGHGCYGFTKNGDEDNCLRDDHYDAAGNHVGKDEAPTVAPTKAPTVAPTSAPTKAPTAAPTSAPTQNPIVDSQYVIAGADEKDPSKINGQVHGYMGDADGDGEASVMDATEIQLQVARLKTMDEIRMLLSDVDRDGDVSVMDATEIQLFVARLKGSDVIGRILYTPINEFDPEKYTYIKADGEYYMVLSNTKSFTYTYYLACDRKVSFIDVTTHYDNDGLKFIPDVDEYGDYTESEFPNIPAPIYNFAIEGEILYNYSNLAGVRFPVQDDIQTDKNTLFTGKFEITGGPGVYDLDTRIRIIGDTNNNKIIHNFEVVDESAIVMTDNEIVGLYHIDKSLVPTEPPTDPPTDPPTEAPTSAPTQPQSTCYSCGDYVSKTYYYNGHYICYSCYCDVTHSSSCDLCGGYVSSPYYYSGYELCYSCYSDLRYSSSCDLCGDYCSSTYYYNGYDLCYDCYYDLKYRSSCDLCGTYVSSPYSYNGYDLCYSCYSDLRYSSYCDNCGTYVSNPYSYGGYDLCYSCYNSYKNAVTCSYCGDRVFSYTYITNAYTGRIRIVCYPCYYDLIY